MSKYTSTRLIDIADLRIGMYVTQLEVPWSETDFPLQGLLVRKNTDIKKLAEYGHIVCIDEAKSLNHTYQANNEASSSIFKQQEQGAFWEEHHHNYRKNKSISNEIAHAETIFNQLSYIYHELTVDLAKLTNKKIIEISAINNQMVTSVLNNPDALLWIAKINASHRRVFEHTVRAAIWATLLGRSMGLSRESLLVLNMAVLLSSVGKSQLRNNVWENYNYLEMHVNYGQWPRLALDKLTHCSNIGSLVLSVISNMAERYDGSGWPNHKCEDEIPLLAQIAGLAESFDLILQPMFSVKKISFNHALKKINDISGTLFSEELVTEFIQATGLYPVGTHVLLSNGYYGVVVEQSRKRRIRGTVALTHNPKEKRLAKFKIVQLGEGKYSKVMIKREMESMQDELVKDELEQITSLINQFKINWFLRMVYFFRRNSWMHN